MFFSIDCIMSSPRDDKIPTSETIPLSERIGSVGSESDSSSRSLSFRSLSFRQSFEPLTEEQTLIQQIQSTKNNFENKSVQEIKNIILNPYDQQVVIMALFEWKTRLSESISPGAKKDIEKIDKIHRIQQLIERIKKNGLIMELKSYNKKLVENVVFIQRALKSCCKVSNADVFVTPPRKNVKSSSKTPVKRMSSAKPVDGFPDMTPLRKENEEAMESGYFPFLTPPKGGKSKKSPPKGGKRKTKNRTRKMYS